MAAGVQIACFPLIMLFCCVGATPEYFVRVANQALRMDGGALLGGDLQVQAVSALEQQVKRVMGADPGSVLNVSSLRDSPDPELLRILFLAVLGNFTSAAISSDWGQPCQLVVDTHTGAIKVKEQPPVASLALKVVVALLVAVQFKQWVMEVRASQAAKVIPHAVVQHGEVPGKGKGN
jgi:hypothetical protein